MMGRPLGAYQDLEPWQLRLLVQALVNVGCPEHTAKSLAAQATFGVDSGWAAGDPEVWMLHLRGTAVGVEQDPEQARLNDEVFADLAERIASGVRDDNAEANDRLQRGERVEVDWPLADRPNRR